MADSIRERICQNVVTTLQGVTEANGYQITLRSVDRLPTSPYQLPEVPCAIVADVSEEEEEGIPVQFSHCSLLFEVKVMLAEFTSISEAANRAIASVKKALRADHHRGGLALDTDIKGNETVLSEETLPYGMVSLSVLVTYRHLLNDPYSQ